MSSKPDIFENVETPFVNIEEIMNSTPFEEKTLKQPLLTTEDPLKNEPPSNFLVDKSTFFGKLFSAPNSILKFQFSIIILAFNSILFYIKKFPYRGSLNFLIMVLISAVIVLHTQQKNPFLLSHLSHFVKIFLDENESTLKLESDGIMGKDLFSIADVLADVNTTVQNYYSFVQNSPDTFVYLGFTNYTTNRTEIMPIKMAVNLWTDR